MKRIILNRMGKSELRIITGAVTKNMNIFNKILERTT